MTFIAILPNLTSSRQCLRKLRILMWYTDNGVTQICLFRILSTVMFKMRVQVWMSCIWKGELKFFGMKCFALIWAFSRRITMKWIQPKFPPFLICLHHWERAVRTPEEALHDEYGPLKNREELTFAPQKSSCNHNFLFDLNFICCYWNVTNGWLCSMFSPSWQIRRQGSGH